MSAQAKQKGDKASYWMRDPDCIGRACFSPGRYQIRGATLSGSRATGGYRDTCMRNSYHGCPVGTDGMLVLPELVKARKGEGWTIR